MDVEQLKSEALLLNPEARAYLAKELLVSLDAITENEIEKLWLDEAIRRDDELDNGRAHVYPVDEVLSRARSRLK